MKSSIIGCCFACATICVGTIGNRYIREQNVNSIDVQWSDEYAQFIQALNQNTSVFFDHRDPAIANGLRIENLIYYSTVIKHNR